MFTDLAYALGTAPGGQAPSGMQGFASLIPMILIFVVFYFLLIRPQQKKAKQHKDFMGNLKKGEYVVTSAGIYGHIDNISNDSDIVVLELAGNVKIKISKGSISAYAKAD